MGIVREIATWRLSWLGVAGAVVMPATTLYDPVRALGYFLVSVGISLSTRKVIDQGLLQKRGH
jgi:hypothetical protein